MDSYPNPHNNKNNSQNLDGEDERTKKRVKKNSPSAQNINNNNNSEDGVVLQVSHKVTGQRSWKEIQVRTVEYFSTLPYIMNHLPFYTKY